MTFLKRSGAAIVAASLLLTLSISSVAAAGATVETFSLDASFSHEEPDGSVTWFEVTGDVRIVTNPDGRQSATVHMRETQVASLNGAVIYESRSVSMQHAIMLGEDLFLVHLNSRSSWSGEINGSLTFVFQIVQGEVVVDHQS